MFHIKTVGALVAVMSFAASIMPAHAEYAASSVSRSLLVAQAFSMVWMILISPLQRT